MQNSNLLSFNKFSAIEQIKNYISANISYFTTQANPYSANLTDFSRREEGIKLQLAFRYNLWSTAVFHGLPICVNLATILAKQCGVEWYTFTERQKANLIENHAWFSKIDKFIEDNINIFKTALGILKVGDTLLFSGLGGYFTDVENVDRLHEYNLLTSQVSTVLSGIALAQVILYDLIWISIKKRFAKKSGHRIDIERAMSIDTHHSVGSYSQTNFDITKVWTENESVSRSSLVRARTSSTSLSNARTSTTFSRNNSAQETCSSYISDDEVPRIVGGDLINQGIVIIERRNIAGFEIFTYRTCYDLPNQSCRRNSIS